MNADNLLETIARAIDPDALWKEPDKGSDEWVDWWDDGWRRAAARNKALRVIAALGLTEEQMYKMSLSDFILPAEHKKWQTRWVTPWQEEEEK